MNSNHILSFTTLASICLQFFAANASAGRESHGGSVVVCGPTVELAEFREVRTRVGLAKKMRIEQQPAVPVDVQIERALAKAETAAPHVAKKLRDYVTAIRAAATPIDSYDWGFSNDANFYPHENGCELKTAVYYISSNVIEYRRDLYDRMSPTDQAGIWVHEAVYLWTRERTDEPGTRLARRIVSLLFSDLDDPELLKGLFNGYVRNAVSLDGKAIPVSKNASSIYIDPANISPNGETPAQMRFWVECVDSNDTRCQHRLDKTPSKNIRFSAFSSESRDWNWHVGDGQPQPGTLMSVTKVKENYSAFLMLGEKTEGGLADMNIRYHWEIRLSNPGSQGPVIAAGYRDVQVSGYGSSWIPDLHMFYFSETDLVSDTQKAKAAAFLDGVLK